MTPAEIRSMSSERLKREWDADDRWAGIERGYGAEEVIRLRGSVEVEHSLARRGAEKLWRVLHTVLVPTGHFVRTLQAARLAADVCNVPTVLVARTDSLSATLLTSDVDERDREFITGERTPEGFFRVRDGLEPVIARMLAYAPHADVLWFETSTPDLDEALDFAAAIHA